MRLGACAGRTQSTARLLATFWHPGSWARESLPSIQRVDESIAVFCRKSFPAVRRDWLGAALSAHCLPL